jgi:hypothetical protein
MSKVNSMAHMPVSRMLRMVHDLTKNLFGLSRLRKRNTNNAASMTG